MVITTPLSSSAYLMKAFKRGVYIMVDLFNLEVEVTAVQFVPAGSHKATIVSLVPSEYTPEYNKPMWSDPTKRIDITYKVEGVGTIMSSESYVAYKRFDNLTEEELDNENISQAPGREGYAVEAKIDDDGNEYFERIIDMAGTLSAQKRFGYIAGVAGVEAGTSSLKQMLKDLEDTKVGIEVVEKVGENSGRTYSQVEDVMPVSKVKDTAVTLAPELEGELADI